MSGKTKPPRNEAWRICWRKHVAPQLSTKGLRALFRALSSNDPTLVQCLIAAKSNRCYSPNAKPEVGCAIGYSLMKSGYRTCLSIHNRYAKFKNIFDFTSWFDYTPMDEVRAKLANEVEMTLLKRADQ